MDADVIRAFAERDRSSPEALHREHVARLFREEGPVATFRLAQALREHARRVRPEWPTERERAVDLAHHLALRRLLDRSAHAFPRR